MVISDAERAWCSCAADLGRIPGQIFYVPVCPRVEFSYSTGKGAFALRVALSHVPLQSAALLPDNQSHAATSHTPTLSSPPPLPLG